MEKLGGLLSRGTCEQIGKKDIKDNANSLNGRFVRIIKDYGAQKEISKAWFLHQENDGKTNSH